MGGSSQSLVLSLDLPHEPKNLFPGVERQSSWFVVPHKGLFSEVAENVSGGVYSNR